MKSVNNYVAIVAAIVVVAGIYFFFKFFFGYRVTLDELGNEPIYVQRLAKHLKSVPRNCSRTQLGEHLAKAGMNSSPDHFKDFKYYWSLTAESYDKPSYVVHAEFVPGSKINSMVLQSVTINIIKTSGGPWRPIWRINYRR